MYRLLVHEIDRCLVDYSRRLAYASGEIVT